MAIPLMDNFSEFERCMEDRVKLVLAGESLVNMIRFRFMVPKNRRWTKKGISYQTTNGLDGMDPSYISLERFLPFFLMGIFILAMLALLMGIMSSN